MGYTNGYSLKEQGEKKTQHSISQFFQLLFPTFCSKLFQMSHSQLLVVGCLGQTFKNDIILEKDQGETMNNRRIFQGMCYII